MGAYKFTNGTGTAVKNIVNGSSCVEGGNGWQKYLDYVNDGGHTDPFKTEDELFEIALAEKLQELRNEKDNRADAAVDTSDPRKKDKIISRAVKLLRREMQGEASPQEKAELDGLAVVDDLLDSLDTDFEAAETWLSDPARSIEQIQGYNVVTDPGWSTLSS